MKITDHAAAKTLLLSHHHDEHRQPPGTVAVRCTDHNQFICWVHPPAPPCRVACPTKCKTTGRQA